MEKLRYSYSKATRKSLQTLRTWLEKEIKKNNRNKRKKRILPYPKFHFKVDNKTGKLILCYSIPIYDVAVKNNIRKKNIQKYLKNYTLDNYKELLDVEYYYKQILEETEYANKEISVDISTLKYWIDKYVSPTPRKGITKVPSPNTLKNDKRFLTGYYDWLKINKPKYLDIWMHNDDNIKNIFTEYLQTKSDDWSDSSIHNCYRCYRAFLNWVSHKEPRFKGNRLSGIEIETPKPILTSFSMAEMEKVIHFMTEFQQDRVWFWFVPMLRIMLITGCRISELINMKCNDLTKFSLNSEDGEEFVGYKWTFKGKGDKERTMYIDSSTSVKDIEGLILDSTGKRRTDKVFVFHKQYYKSPNTKQDTNMGGGMVNNIDEPYSRSGVEHKFKKMVQFLKLDPKLTPHSCRRFYIGEKLMETGGNIPMVALLVGHQSYKMINHYAQHNQQKEMLVGTRNTLDLGKVFTRKKGKKR
jgi:site-specific recombinase XerD